MAVGASSAQDSSRILLGVGVVNSYPTICCNIVPRIICIDNRNESSLSASSFSRVPTKANLATGTALPEQNFD